MGKLKTYAGTQLARKITGKSTTWLHRRDDIFEPARLDAPTGRRIYDIEKLEAYAAEQAGKHLSGLATARDFARNDKAKDGSK